MPDNLSFTNVIPEAVGYLAAKSAAELSYGLAGRLYLSKSGWLLLSVPNAFLRGCFNALSAPGAELPRHDDGSLNAHISVMHSTEVESIGPDKLSERGKLFRYTLGKTREVNPKGWDGVERCWFVEAHSPELEKLRKSYGLSALPNDGKHKFHITFAVRKKNVLRNNETKKADEEVRKAVLITGNPKFLLQQNELAEPFYRQIESLLKEHGYETQRDPGEAHTMPEPADLWVGHSRGADRLRFAPDTQATIAIGSRMAEAVNDPEDDVATPFQRNGTLPPAAHYRVPAEFISRLEALTKKAEELSRLQQLLRAKMESDRKNYEAKHQILRELIDQYPDEFVIDSPEGRYQGTTHTPTKFKMHGPRNITKQLERQ